MPIVLGGSSVATLPEVILLGDLTGTPFGGPHTLTDYSDYLELGGNGQPISTTLYRQDEQSDVQPAQFSFVLDNRDGRFTTGPEAITTQDYFRVQIAYGSTTFDLVTGYVDAVEQMWPGGVYTHAQVRVSCTDISGRLGEGQPLRSMVEQEMLADNPTYLYPLTEEAGSTSAGDVAGGNVAARRVNSKYGATKADFGTEMSGLVDSLTGVYFGGSWGPIVSVTTNPGSALAIAYDNPSGRFLPSSGGFSLEAWVITPGSAPGASYDLGTILYQGDSTASRYLQVYIDPADGKPYVNATDGTNTLLHAATSKSICDGKLHHLLVTVDAVNQFGTLYVDGVAAASLFAAGGVNLSGLRYNLIGAAARSAYMNGQFPGTVALVALYPGELTAARALAHYQAGLSSFTESSDARFARLLSYAGLTSTALPAGVATMGGQQLSGKTLVEALKQVGDTEGGAVYVTPGGELTFERRNARYWSTAAFSLTADDINGDVIPRKDRLGLVNDQTATRDGGAAQRYTDAASIDAYGRHDGGSLAVAPSTDYEARQIAAWRVVTGKDPKLRLSTVTIDLLAQPSSSIVEALLAAQISTAFTLTGMPSQNPGGTSMSLFVEGMTWTIGKDVFTVALFTSPTSAIPNMLRAEASPSTRTRLDSGLKIPL